MTKILIDGFIMTTAYYKGPAADTTVTAGGSATITLSLSAVAGSKKVSQVMGIKELTGIPAGLAIAGITVSEDSITVTLNNPTAADVTVTANSVSATAVVLAY